MPLVRLPRTVLRRHSGMNYLCRSFVRRGFCKSFILYLPSSIRFLRYTRQQYLRTGVMHAMLACFPVLLGCDSNPTPRQHRKFR